MTSLGLMKVQIEEGDPHDCRQALQLVIDYLHDVADAGDMRAVRCIALLAGVDISLGELESRLRESPVGEGLRSSGECGLRLLME
jgi:hypothetical protein